jgi:L-lactate dehydrogenase
MSEQEIAMMQTRKVVILGVGHVGSHVANSLVTQGFCDELVLVDQDSAKAAAHSRDLADAVPHLPCRVRVRAGTLADLAGADLAVVAASGPIFKEDRLEELADNVAVMDQLIPAFRQAQFSGLIISITNPCDVIAWYLQEQTGCTVIGTGTLLDSARLQSALAAETGWNARSIQAYCLGEHGDSQLVAWDAVTFGGKPATELLREQPQWLNQLNQPAIAYDVMKAGWNIVVGKGATEFGIGAAAARLINTIFCDEKTILPVSSLWQGEYGEAPVFASTPSVIGRTGVEQRLELTLNATERTALRTSCAVIREAYDSLQR